MPTPVKMSQFDVLSGPMPSGSYFLAIIPNGMGGFQNVKVSDSDFYTYTTQQIQSMRWKTPPASSFSPGSEGDEAFDSQYYYLYSNGTWKRISLGGLF